MQSKAMDGKRDASDFLDNSSFDFFIFNPGDGLYEKADDSCTVVYWDKAYLDRGSRFKNSPDVYISLLFHSEHLGCEIAGTLGYSRYCRSETSELSLVERIFNVCLPVEFVEVCRFSIMPFLTSLSAKLRASRLLIYNMIKYAQSINALYLPAYMISLPAIASFLQSAMKREFLEEAATDINMDEVPPQSRCFFSRGPKLYKIHIDKLL